MKINEMLSLEGCWKMVNRIQLGNSGDAIRERCAIAEEWLTKNKVISIPEFDELMRAVSYWHCESYHIDKIENGWRAR